MATKAIPSMMRKWTIKRVMNNFRKACELETVAVPIDKMGPKDVLVRNRFVGINASDINYTAGRYDPTTTPVDVGFESIAEVVKVGSGCSRLSPGVAVGNGAIGTFSEYQVVPEDAAFALPSVKADYMPLVISGPGAAIGLDTIGKIQPSDIVYITGAAGGAGSIAVQYAKQSGCHVIGTCSSDDKKEFLKSLGCDRPINYKKENVADVLRAEYPNGINVMFENVGGDLLRDGINNLAFKGRCVLFGLISSYESQDLNMASFPNLTMLILKCATMEGYMYFTRLDLFPEYVGKLSEMYDKGKLKLDIDNGARSDGGAFKSIEDIPRAIEYMYNGKNQGKVVVEFSD